MNVNDRHEFYYYLADFNLYASYLMTLFIDFKVGYSFTLCCFILFIFRGRIHILNPILK